jgi:hypothetical protein
LIEKWNLKGIDLEVKSFLKVLSTAKRNRLIEKLKNEETTSLASKTSDDSTDPNPPQRSKETSAILIQKTWRGYSTRKHVHRINKQNHDELKFQLLLEHRRNQRKRKIELLEIIEILPPDQIEEYIQKQRHFSAKMIQANFRGYLQRKKLSKLKQQQQQHKAAVTIQRGVLNFQFLSFKIIIKLISYLKKKARRMIKKNKIEREKPAFYARPSGLNSEKREELLDKIRRHLDSLPVI